MELLLDVFDKRANTLAKVWDELSSLDGPGEAKA
jgi:hypothetical protein